MIGGTQCIRYPEIAKGLRDDLDRLNSFLNDQQIEGTCFRGLRRIFNNGHNPDFRWRDGGRHYAIGEANYQTYPESERLRFLRINGEAVAEIDLRASHLALLHGLTGAELDKDRDPYEVAGFPRDVVKAWLTQFLGSGGRATRWAKGTAKSFTQADDDKSTFAQTYQFKQVKPSRFPNPNSSASFGVTMNPAPCRETPRELRPSFAFNGRADSTSLPTVRSALIVPSLVEKTMCGWSVSSPASETTSYSEPLPLPCAATVMAMRTAAASGEALVQG